MHTLEPAPADPAPSAAASRPLIVVANRLPVSRCETTQEWTISPGGLVSALTPVVRRTGGTWVGWDGTEGDPSDGDESKPFVAAGVRMRRVRLSGDDIEGYYRQFANGVLWPLFHDAVRAPAFSESAWRQYLLVNERFARVVADSAPADALVWLQDYHLLMVPVFLRQLRPDLATGLFLHIPAPPPSLFASLPWRDQIVESLGCLDLIGTQTTADAANLRQTLGAQAADDSGPIHAPGVRVEAFPISIDSGSFLAKAREIAGRGGHRLARESLGASGRVLMLGVDRLDYTKGIDARLRAFESALESGQIDPGACRFVQIAVPSRGDVEPYRQIDTAVDALVGRINGRFGALGETIVHYQKSVLGFEDLITLYLAADVMVVTPFKDGMNLVAKEFLATRADGRGELILSEFAGAAEELRDATLINPHDELGLRTALAAAYERARGGAFPPATLNLHRRVMEHDVHEWADLFLVGLNSRRPRPGARRAPAIAAPAPVPMEVVVPRG